MKFFSLMLFSALGMFLQPSCTGSIARQDQDGDDSTLSPSGPNQGGSSGRNNGGGPQASQGGAGGATKDPSLDPTDGDFDPDSPGVVIIEDVDDPGLSETPQAKLAFTENFETVAIGDPWQKACKWKKHTQVKASCGVQGGRCLHIKQDPFNTEPKLFPLPPIADRPPYPASSDGQCHPYYTNTATDVIQDVIELPYASEYSLSYDIYFEPGYDWARGGKLPGLSAKEWDSGCSIEGDGLKTDPAPNRWSVRVMWREDGASELYVYDQSRIPGRCGARLRTQMPFITGTWRAVTVYVKLNSAASAKDGVAQLYFDGKLAQSLSGVQFRTTTQKDSLIRNIFFSTFYGGNESKRLYCQSSTSDQKYCQPIDPKIETTWVPGSVGNVRFDNLAVYAGLKVRKAPGQ